jgi:hypothetical protein
VFGQSWYNAVNNSNCLVTYKLFKSQLNFENYLDYLPRKLRICLSKLRISSHKLAIETGRHNNIDRAERYCIICNSNDIEDEYHFIIKCPFFDALRKEYIKPFYYRRPSVAKFIELMRTKNKTEIKNLARFVLRAFHLRSNMN